ncbi:MAG: hypothetical protein OEM02_15200, partial [Desulfobulbaceae bacterium]|nr:hypothetical protein [Desulfobulbaceae bacterium]
AVTLYVELPYGVLVVSPIDDFIATGISSGPFSPASKTYTLSNFGGATLDFSVTKNAAWLDLSTISDSIPGYDSTTVTLTLNTEAEKLLFGNYTDTITFSNDIDATQDATRLVDLTVERKPVSWGMFLPAIINGKK